MSRRHSIVLAAIAVLCASGIFWRFAGHGLWGGFMPDDLMNLYRAARTPALEFIRGTLSPWAGEWRPFGFLLFKGLYSAFGFNPLPYHLLALSLIAANAALLALLTWRLTASGAATAFTALFACHHGYFSDLYFNSGTMFDTLAATLCLALLLCHINQPRPGPARLCLQTFLFLLALQTKEIAIFLPAALWGHEFLIRRDPTAWRTARQAWAMTLLASILAAGLLLNGGEVIRNPDYRPSLSPAILLEHWEHYLASMFYQPYGPGAGFTVSILGAATAAAWLARDAVARWAWLLAFTAPLPVLAVTPRSFYAFYVPYLFWALLAGVLLAKLTRGWKWAPAALFIPLAAFLVERHMLIQPHAEKWHRDATEEMRPALTLLAPEARAWTPGVSLVFLDDPYPPDDYTLLYVAALASGDLNLAVHRVKAGIGPTGPHALRYTLTADTLHRHSTPGTGVH